MNMRTTIALVLLSAAGLGAWYASGSLPGFLAEIEPPAGPPDASLNLAEVREVEIERPGGNVLLQRAGDDWRLAGGWATRPAEVRRLLDTLANLRSRFAPESPEGFTPRLSVRAVTADGERRLHFGDKGQRGGFDSPSYVRSGEESVVVRLAPGIVDLLDRPAEYYQQRRLFPSQRERKDDTGTARVERVVGKEVVVEEKGEKRFALARVGDTWELQYPLRDALDPRARDDFLEAMAELWAERFIEAPEKFEVERRVTLTRTDGSTLTLEIAPIPLGGLEKPKTIARLVGNDQYFEMETTRFNAIFPSVVDTLRDAQLLRFRPEDVRMLTLQSASGEIILTNASPRRTPANLDDPPPPPADWRIGDLKADSEAIERLLTNLANLSTTERDAGLRVQTGAAVTAVSLPGWATPWFAHAAAPQTLLGIDPPAATLTLKVEEGPIESPREKMFMLSLGRHDAEAKKLFAISNGYPRVNEISDELVELVKGKTALDFRGKRLLSLTPGSLATLRIDQRGTPGPGLDLLGLPPLAVVARLAPEGESLTLERAGDGWNLTQPVKTTAESSLVQDLVDKLAQLEVVRYVTLAQPQPTAEEVLRFGLDRPLYRVQFGSEVLLIGRPVVGGDGWYARRQGAPEIFVLANDLVALVARDSLGYRPNTLWTVAADDPIVEFAFTRGEKEPAFRIVRKKDSDDWEVVGPFTVDVPREVAESLVQSLSAPRAASFVAHDAKDEATKPFGLDTPQSVVTLKTKGGKTHTLQLGGDSTQGRYARLDGQTAVFRIGEELAAATRRRALDFLDTSLLNLEANRITGLTRTASPETLELVKKDDSWLMTKPSEQIADERKVPEFLKLLAKLRAERLVAYESKNVQPFGLDKPSATFTLLPDKQTLLLGAEIPGTGERYAQVQGNPAIGVLDAQTATRLLASPLSLRDHRLARIPDADSMTLTAGERQITFSKPEGTWKVTAPLETDADHDALESFLNSLSRLRADEFVAEKPDAAALQKFGLDKPAARWVLTLDDKNALDLTLGANEPAGSRRYARLAGNDTVFLLEADVARQALTEYRPRTVLKNIDPAQIESVRFGYREGAFTLVRDGSDWKVEGQPDFRLDNMAVSDALAPLRDLKLERYVRDDKAALKLYGLDPAELVLEITTRDGKQTLLIGGREGASQRRYARQPTSKAADVFVLDEATCAKLVKPLGEFQAK
jgi:hypothetical protein